MSDDDFCPPVTLSSEPIHLPAKLHAAILANVFRSLAKQFLSCPPPTLSDKASFLNHLQLEKAAGNKIIEAARAGLIPDALAELRELVDWHTRPAPPFTGRTQYVRGPHNLFIDLVGGNMIEAENLPGGLKVITDEHGHPKLTGGLMPRLDPMQLQRTPNEREAAACEFMATVIEQAVVERERQEAGGGGPPDQFTDLRRLAREFSKQERAVLVAICNAGGDLSLADVKVLCEWTDPIESAWNSLRARLNEKLERHGWRLKTKGRAAKLEKYPPGSPLKTS